MSFDERLVGIKQTDSFIQKACCVLLLLDGLVIYWSLTLICTQICLLLMG